MPVLAGMMAVSSCKKAFDLQPQTVVGPENAYRNVFDADAAVIGVYGKFMNLAKQYVVLNELRADLMTVTQNADLYLQQINKNSVTADNPYADPTPFYQVILNCNDVLKNFDKMKAENKLKEAEYYSRWADVAAIRSFVYLQLGIHFGTVPYVTDPLADISDVKNETLFPKISFQQLLQELIKTMESVPAGYILPYTTGTSLVTTVDQYTTAKFFINKNILLGDLYLWNGAYDPASYRKAATSYRTVISTGDNAGNKDLYHLIGVIDVTTGNNVGVQYVRYRDNDINALYESNTEGWRSMFSRGKINYDALWNDKWIWVLPFSSNFAPQNPFIDLFSNRGGSYLVKPSQEAIDNWNSQVQINNFPFDARGRFTYKIIDGQPVIMKYLYYYLDGFTFTQTINANARTGDWFLYRDEMLWQHFAEAANRERFHKLAYAIVNQGIRTTYTPPITATNPDNNNVTNIQQTFLPPPYDFDARNGDNPQYRSIYRDMAGLRGRANLKTIPVTNPADSLTQLENSLVDEAGRELAYEGLRWPDLLRIAIRRNDASFLTSKVAAKLRKEGLGGDAARVEGLSLNQLYLPFKWQ